MDERLNALDTELQIVQASVLAAREHLARIDAKLDRLADLVITGESAPQGVEPVEWLSLTPEQRRAAWSTYIKETSGWVTSLANLEPCSSPTVVPSAART